MGERGLIHATAGLGAPTAAMPGRWLARWQAATRVRAIASNTEFRGNQRTWAASRRSPSGSAAIESQSPARASPLDRDWRTRDKRPRRGGSGGFEAVA